LGLKGKIMTNNTSKELTVLAVRGEGYGVKLECKETNGIGIVFVDPFIGCAVDIPEDISINDYASVAKGMIGKRYSMPQDCHIFQPEYIPNEGEFVEIVT
tara:strand:+ start:483 stop:782 length:300 start_codon:yes stop_codon:yes gene_type:complete